VTRWSSITVVVCAYDEADNVVPVLEETIDYLRRAAEDFEVLVVDDGSRDDTAARAETFAAAEPSVRVIRHGHNRGIGAALKTGYAQARCEWVTFLPADGQIDPAELDLFRDAASRADLVTSRYARRDDDAWRLFLSKGLRVLVRTIGGRTAPSQGIYVVRREVLERILLRSESFFLNLELALRAAKMGLRVETVTMHARARRSGASKSAGLRQIRTVFTELLRYRLGI
jgi:glycosyltransferase involved in cell wall biosynthesis